MRRMYRIKHINKKLQSISLILTMTAVLWLCKADLKAHVDAGTDQEHLQHKIVDGLDEEGPERGSRRHLFLISAEMLHSNI